MTLPIPTDLEDTTASTGFSSWITFLPTFVAFVFEITHGDWGVGVALGDSVAEFNEITPGELIPETAGIESGTPAAGSPPIKII